jgi:hypothetical protein
MPHLPIGAAMKILHFVWLHRFAFAFILVSLLVVAFVMLRPSIQRFYWVGNTDIEIEFLVTDALTGETIQGATIQVRVEGEECGGKKKEQFNLVTGANGSVKRLVRNCMSFGTVGDNIDTFAMHLPLWSYQVSRDGYIPSEWKVLDDMEYAGKVQRGTPAATLLIQIPLRDCPISQLMRQLGSETRHPSLLAPGD